MVFKPILTRHDVKNIAGELRRRLRRAGIKVQKLILFGSYARGTPHPWSDVDLCVVSSHFGRNDFDEMVHVSQLAKSVNYLVEVHTLHPTELRQGRHPLAAEIQRTGKPV